MKRKFSFAWISRFYFAWISRRFRDFIQINFETCRNISDWPHQICTLRVFARRILAREDMFPKGVAENSAKE